MSWRLPLGAKWKKVIIFTYLTNFVWRLIWLIEFQNFIIRKWKPCFSGMSKSQRLTSTCFPISVQQNKECGVKMSSQTGGQGHSTPVPHSPSTHAHNHSTLSHAFARSPIHVFACSLVHAFALTLVCAFARSLVCAFASSLVWAFARLLVCAFACSLVCTFARWYLHFTLIH